MKYFNYKEKIKLARSLLLKTNPIYVQYYLTARCNMSCEQCNIIYAHADSAEMNIRQIRDMAQNMAEIGVCIVLLIGGEPFVRHDIVEIIQAFTDVGIHVRMQTNGLAKRETLQKCIQAGAHDISISLDSLDPFLQDSINGAICKSWEQAIETTAIINEIFPENGSAFFGTVLMPKNLFHIEDILEFATTINWGISLVPVHLGQKTNPLRFRTFDENRTCTFSPENYNDIKKVIARLKQMKKEGYNLYSSEEYLNDIYSFIVKNKTRWRRRNYNICDSPNLYFSIDPNGNIAPCCDYKLQKSYPVYDTQFPKWFYSGEIHNEIYKITTQCPGCMFGSYPEITITSRYLLPLLKRFIYFNHRNIRPKKLSADEMMHIAHEIFQKNSKRRKMATKRVSN